MFFNPFIRRPKCCPLRLRAFAFKFLLIPSLFLISFSSPAAAPDLAWDSPGTGNVVLPGYFADPSILYDDATDSFYVYATSDGQGIADSAEPHVAVTKDFYNWRYVPVVLPAGLPVPPNSMHAGIWAPTVMRHPVNGRYYLAYGINVSTYVFMSDSPLGPWVSATRVSSGASSGRGEGEHPAPIPLLPRGNYFSGDGFDGQFYTEGTNVYMVSGGGGVGHLCKIETDKDGFLSLNRTDPRFDRVARDGSRFHTLTPLACFLEGSEMIKIDGLYYYAYSFRGAQHYNVHYATSTNLFGPFAVQPGEVVAPDRARNLLGPGHHSFFRFGDDWYILYHRQHYPFEDPKRQVCVDHVTIKDGHISNRVESHAGLSRGADPLARRYQAAKAAASRNLAFGCPALAGSVHDYEGGRICGENWAPIPGFFKADYAFDDNFGTRWESAHKLGDPDWLIVDLGADHRVTGVQIFFEFTTRPYNFRIDLLPAAAAATLAGAAASTNWISFVAGTSTYGAPITAPAVTARYVRLTVLGSDSPGMAVTTRFRGLTVRPSVWEFRVFGGK